MMRLFMHANFCKERSIKMSTRFLVITAVLFLLPFLGLMGLGGYWLWEHDWLYQAVGMLSANSLLIYTLIHYRRQNSRAERVTFNPIQANPYWTDDGQQAFEALAAVTERWKNEADLLTNAPKALRLTNEILTTVARHFHADSKYPLLEFPLPYLLKLITLVCNDIQNEVLNKIPASHAITISDFLRAKAVVDNVKRAQPFWEVGRLLFDWSGVVFAKARGVLLDQGISYVTDEISQRLVSVYVNKLGYYAIQLYSGQITLEDIVPTSVLTPDSIADTNESAEHEQTLEPLRILVLGQVSSGKSSLINALFGEVKSAVSVLPTTSEITPYILERDGLQQAIILDSAGYGGLTHHVLPDDLKKEWTKIDIILMVCSASNAARSTDAAQLKAIRDYFQEQRKQVMPVVIGVVTHIDRLRPLQEWQPPYNVVNPDTSKAKNIRAVCVAIATDLHLPLKNVVPVCLNPQTAAYNIDEGLMPIIHEQLDDAQRVRYLRCLRHQQNQSYWQQWRKQASTLGRVFFG
jgi:hypothetical protein